ncbi:MAG: gamma carbonic anhydrase family protein [Gemmatimonadota bacterium]|jgi:carbonic anhydrase/acetyltransferase-like protein (isoleucine patch superfamily)
MALVIPFRGKTPDIHPSVFLAPNVVVIGNVSIGAESSVWFGAVIRGDDPDNAVVIGRRTSIQENCVIHVGHWGPTHVGDDVTVGHGAKFECCAIGDRSVVGMNAVILQNATIGEECVLAANTVVLEGSEIPDRSVVAGVPGKVKKTLEGGAAEWIRGGGEHYVRLSREYIAEGIGGHDTSEPLCDLCGSPMRESHCKLICDQCGYIRDCSDP